MERVVCGGAELKSLMKHSNKDLRPLYEGDVPNRGAYLFGVEFGARAKTVSDNFKALKGIKPSFHNRHFS